MWLAVLPLVLQVDPVWTAPLGEARSRVAAIQEPLHSQRQQAFDELERALLLWERERREWVDEQVLEQQRVTQKTKDETPLPAEALERFKVIEVGKGGKAKGASRAKIIELPKKDRVDAEVEQLAYELEQRRALCRTDKQACEAERKKRALLQKGNTAFDAATQAEYEKRQAAIDDEADRLSKGVSEARER